MPLLSSQPLQEHLAPANPSTQRSMPRRGLPPIASNALHRKAIRKEVLLTLDLSVKRLLNQVSVAGIKQGFLTNPQFVFLAAQSP